MASNVIKAQANQTLGGRVVVKRNAQLAGRQADEILKQAREEAELILAEARRKADETLATAERTGLRKGESQWYEALTTAWKSRDDYMAANEHALLKLAVRIAEKLMGEELRTAPDKIVSLVREALRSTRRAKTLVIQAHPEDAALLSARRAAICGTGNTERQLEIVPNAALSRGDCVIESEIGSIDARLETQLKNIGNALTGRTSA